MNIISRLRAIFTPVASPTTMANFSPSGHIKVQSQTESIKSSSKASTLTKHSVSTNWTNIVLYITQAIARVFLGAIVLTFLAILAPELRERVPSLYQFVDLLMVGLEWICSQVMNIFEKVF